MLAVAVPFYKIAYFEELLQALSKQTNMNFNVYIGNDCSSDNPDVLIKQYSAKLNIVYKRFESRLGNINLTKQWERCVELIGNEEWLWVLPDDDLPSINCVKEFYQALESVSISSVNVIRFPVEVIDGNGVVLTKPSPLPLLENNYQFYMRQLKGEGTGSSLGDNIFRRRIFENSGGFVDFPKGWGSDHATVLNVSAGGLIYCLQNATLGFRMSGENISSDINDGVVKMNAKIAFANWLKAHEDIFPEKPDAEFYWYIYLKGEYYAMYEWKFNALIWLGLYRLRQICINSSNPLPLFLLILKRLFARGKP